MALPKIVKDIEARVRDTGDTMTGLLSAHGGISLDDSTPQNTAPQYLLGVTAFANGGTVQWSTVSSVASALMGSLDGRYVNVTGDSMTGTLRLGAPYHATANARYTYAALEIREADRVGSAQSDIGYAPRIGFHWGGRTAASLVYHSDGAFYFRNQADTGQASIHGYEIYSDSWFRSYNTNGWYNETYGCHLRAHDGSYGSIRIHGNARNGYEGLHFGTGNSGMTIMSINGSSQGLYQESTGTWIIYNLNGAVGLGGSGTTSGYKVTTNGSHYITGSTYSVGAIGSGARIYTGYDSGVANSISCSNWFRSSGQTGWYNASYGGGWYQTDSTYIRTHGTFQVYSPGRYLSGDTPSSWLDGLKNRASYRIDACGDTGSYHPWIQQTNTGSGYCFSLGMLGTSFYFIGCPTSQTANGYTAGMSFNVANGYLQGCSRVYNAVWNDYAEFRKADIIEPGRVVIEGPSGKMLKSTFRLQAGGSIISDTYGTAMGETDECKTPIAVAGRVLAYTYEPINDYEIGDVVCTGPNGTVSKMTREEIIQWPDRIIGIVSEIPTYDVWGQENIKVNGRIWIKIK